MNSSYYIFGGSPIILIGSGWILFIINLYLIGFISFNVFKNILLLRGQYLNLLDPSMEEIRSGIKKKIIMFAIFGIIIDLYYLYSSIQLALFLSQDMADKTKLILKYVNSLVCSSVLILVTTIFHPCFFTASFQLGQMRGDFGLTCWCSL